MGFWGFVSPGLVSSNDLMMTSVILKVKTLMMIVINV